MAISNTDIVQFYAQDNVPELFKVDGEGSRRIITLGDGSKIRFAPTKYKLHLVENLSDSKIIPNNKKHQGEFFIENYALNDPEDGFFKEGRWLPVAILDSTRVMFPGKYEAGVKSEPVCKSNDGVIPSKTVMVPQNQNCKDCEQSKWKKGEAGVEPPKCGETIHVIFFDIDKKIFFMCSFSSTRISPWNKLMKQVSTILDTAFIRGLDLSSYIVVAKVIDKSSYYNFEFSYVPVVGLNVEVYKLLITWYLDNILPEIIKERKAYEETNVSSGPAIEAAVIKGFEDAGLGDKEFKDIEL